MANTHLLMTPSTSLRRGGETMRNRAVRPNRESARAMDFVSIICFWLGGRLPTTVMVWYLYQGFTARAEIQSEPRPWGSVFERAELRRPRHKLATVSGVRRVYWNEAGGTSARSRRRGKPCLNGYMIEARGSSLPPGGNSGPGPSRGIGPSGRER